MLQRSSFETAQRYLDGISQHLRLTTTYDAPLILIGNKLDLERYRQDNSTNKKCSFEFRTFAKSEELTVETNVQRHMSIIVLTRRFPRPFGVIFISFPFPIFYFYVRTTCRQVSKAEGSSLAHFYNAAFFETSAAEEFNCVERVFHEAIRGASLNLL